ncbi:MAG TPA: Flp pilus assembly protein CpaB [Devosiaceae bacterium]|nr:Flp pilus assembly protein CpaB [Devosiaceae bacterium]
MKANVLVMLGLAVVFGVAAVFLSNVWLSSQQPRAALAGRDAHPENTVVVAAVPLKFGDRLTPENTREIPWTAGAIPTGSFTTRDQLLGDKKDERQVLTAISSNEPILNWKVTGAGQRATLSAVLDKGMSAVSIRVNDVAGVAGFVLPGDRVDILLSRRTNDQSFVDVLLQNIKVLAIDQTADDRKENPTVAKAVTVQVSTVDAQKLTLAAGVGELSLALRQVGANADDSTGRVSLADLSGAVVPVVQQASTTPPPEPEIKKDQAPITPSRPTSVQVTIYRGIAMKTYEVPIAD